MYVCVCVHAEAKPPCNIPISPLTSREKSVGSRERKHALCVYICAQVCARMRPGLKGEGCMHVSVYACIKRGDVIGDCFGKRREAFPRVSRTFDLRE